MSAATSQNPAIARQTTLTPVRLEELANNPAEFAVFMRKFALVYVDDIHHRLATLDIPFTQRLAVLEQVTKMATTAEAKTSPVLPGAGATININFGSSKPPTPAPTITIENAP